MNYFKVNFKASLYFSLLISLLFLNISYLKAEKYQDISKKITIQIKDKTLKEALADLEKKSDFLFFYKDAIFDNTQSRINAKFENQTISEILTSLLANTNNVFTITGRQVIFHKKTDKQAQTLSTQRTFMIQGVVVDQDGEVLPGATISILGQKSGGTSTNEHGQFSIMVASTDTRLLVSYLGYESKVVELKETSLIKLHPTPAQLKDVVVTGVYERKAESYTGAAATIGNKDLTRVGNQNVVQSLKLLDPSIYIPDNLTMGSDPNTMPSISMGGSTSFPLEDTEELRSKYQNDPNQPLFILDGFEASVEQIVDMNMNRVESVTILKDASAKALYGAKAANGVIVIETKRLQGNEQIVSYTGSVSLNIPDLTSYNLTNAAEKLEIERIEGMYTSTMISEQERLIRLYNGKKKRILEGLDTYWLAKPLRTGVEQKHNINVELGDARSLRTSIDFTYNNQEGVMKESGRDNISGAINISYRKNNLLFRNQFSIVSNKSEDSPYGAYSLYSRLNPYWEATDANGTILPLVTTIDRASISGSGGDEDVANPMYDATIGTSLKETYLNFINNFYLKWTITPELSTDLRIGVTNQRDDTDQFYPAQHSMFISYNEEKLNRKGAYILTNGKMSKISGDFNINYNKTFNKHSIYSNLFASMESYQEEQYTHKAEGFINNQFADISFARQYAEGTKPTGNSAIKRQVGFTFSSNYDYDNRYLADITIRRDASSLYGSDNRWATNWAVGLGWNLHKESFLTQFESLRLLKIRGSVGDVGNQAFSTNEAIGTYNYYTGDVYGGFLGAYLSRMPNNKLKWEQSREYNLGLDTEFYGLGLTFNYKYKRTKNMLTTVTIPTSTGFAIVKDNLGLVEVQVPELKLNYTLRLGDKGFVNMHGSFQYEKDKILSLTESMKENNRQARIKMTSSTLPGRVYEDGYSLNTMWVVPSAGIDPTSGREIFIKKDGSYTYVYSTDDIVAVGVDKPKYRGTFGFTTEYKGFGFSSIFSYLGGGQIYNTTLRTRVEDADINYNVDYRVYAGRWREPGQIAQFKSIKINNATLATSRFVQDRNELQLASISTYYEFPSKLIEKIKLRRLRLTVYANNVATFSSVKVERGLDYPFARNISFQLNAEF